MSSIDRHRLHFGPYRTPAFSFGSTIECQTGGQVTISRLSDGRIPWPMTVRRGGASLVLCGDLARAVQTEAACAVGVPARNAGDRLLKREYARGENGKRARTAALATAAAPERRAKISAAQRGKSHPSHVIEAIRKAMTGRTLSSEHRLKVIRFLRRQTTAQPTIRPAWRPAETVLTAHHAAATQEIACFSPVRRS